MRCGPHPRKLAGRDLRTKHRIPNVARAALLLYQTLAFALMAGTQTCAIMEIAFSQL